MQERISGRNAELERRLMSRLAVSGIMFMMVNLHHVCYRESPRDMAELTLRMVTQPLLPYLEELF